MNLIDRDALCKILMSIMDKKAEHEYTRGWNDGLFEAIHHVETLPVHSDQLKNETEQQDDCFFCESIKDKIKIDHDDVELRFINYCPCCGRKLVK